MDMPVEHQPDVAPAEVGDRHVAPEAIQKLTDPVCGMAVTAASPHHLTHEARPYYFCSARCQSSFAADPSAHVADRVAADAPAVRRFRT